MKNFNTAFASPLSGLNIHVHTIDTATVGVIHGEKRMNLKNPLPLNVFLRRSASKSPPAIVGNNVPILNQTVVPNAS